MTDLLLAQRLHADARADPTDPFAGLIRMLAEGGRAAEAARDVVETFAEAELAKMPAAGPNCAACGDPVRVGEWHYSGLELPGVVSLDRPSHGLCALVNVRWGSGPCARCGSGAFACGCDGPSPARRLRRAMLPWRWYTRIGSMAPRDAAATLGRVSAKLGPRWVPQRVQELQGGPEARAPHKPEEPPRDRGQDAHREPEVGTKRPRDDPIAPTGRRRRRASRRAREAAEGTPAD